MLRAFVCCSLADQYFHTACVKACALLLPHSMESSSHEAASTIYPGYEVNLGSTPDRSSGPWLKWTLMLLHRWKQAFSHRFAFLCLRDDIDGVELNKRRREKGALLFWKRQPGDLKPPAAIPKELTEQHYQTEMFRLQRKNKLQPVWTEDEIIHHGAAIGNGSYCCIVYNTIDAHVNCHPFGSSSAVFFITPTLNCRYNAHYVSPHYQNILMLLCVNIKYGCTEGGVITLILSIYRTTISWVVTLAQLHHLQRRAGVWITVTGGSIHIPTCSESVWGGGRWAHSRWGWDGLCTGKVVPSYEEVKDLANSWRIKSSSVTDLSVKRALWQNM